MSGDIKYIDEYRDAQLVHALAGELRRLVTEPMRIMEVCGTHTMSIFSHGLRELFPKNLELISGPGCPVCVTPVNHLDDLTRIARLDRVALAVFGDLTRVPGPHGSLAEASADGARVEVIYSPMDALTFARNEPDLMWVFPAIGFETTAPAAAAAVLEAARLQLDNFCVYPANKLMPPALAALLADPRLSLDGLLCPGHVSVIIGLKPYQFLADEHNLACAVAGFEPVDIFRGLVALARMIRAGEPRVENAYARAVDVDGNQRARKLLDTVFVAEDAQWRGLGVIPQSGLALREEFAGFDALQRLDITPSIAGEPAGCRCGDILQGRCSPRQCPLYGTRCTPLEPVGPCMVSSEGTCAAYYRFAG